MILCVDVGNSHIYGGVFADKKIVLKFRHTSVAATSDMLGLFLKQVLTENGCDPTHIQCISIASVVPSLDYSLRAACLKYFSIEPFILQAGVKTGLQIKCKNPVDVGADRIANAISAVAAFPGKNLIIIDFGTATTFCAIDSNKSYLGGSIMPGMRLSVDSLAEKTAKLPSVEIIKTSQAVGRTTVENIQAGIFLGTVGACREIISRMKQTVFLDNSPIVLATGGFASLFDKENLYDYLMPDLVLDGLRLAVLLAGCNIPKAT